MTARVRDSARISLALGVLALSPAAFSIPPEVWVVNEASRDISIIDDLADTPATIETVSLGGPGDPPPYGIAFSTVVGATGDHVFVSQGGDLKVLDFDTRTLASTFDMASESGYFDVVLKGLDSARPERYPDVASLANYLHAAAEVRPGPGDPFEPWFFVLDQAVSVEFDFYFAVERVTGHL